MKISGYNLNAASRLISQINGLTDIEREERKHVAKWKIFNYHLKNNEFYNFKLNNKIPKKWADIPIIQKKTIKKNRIRHVKRIYKQEHLHCKYIRIIWESLFLC